MRYFLENPPYNILFNIRSTLDRWRHMGAIRSLSFAVFDGFLHLHDVMVECIATSSVI